MANLIIRMDNVGFRYERGAEVLKNITLNIPRGSFHFLTGVSGAGKSTLLKLMYMAQYATRGQVEIFQRNPVLLSRHDRAGMRRKIGVIFQEFRLLDHLSVFDNIALPLRIVGEKEDSIQRKVRELLEFVELGDFMYNNVATLSGGQQQRTSMARAVVTNPSLLLADEPTGNIDEQQSQRLLQLFEHLNAAQGTTIIMASHNEHLLSEYNHPRLLLARGQLHTPSAQAQARAAREALENLAPAPRPAAPHSQPVRALRNASLEAAAEATARLAAGAAAPPSGTAPQASPSAGDALRRMSSAPVFEGTAATLVAQSFPRHGPIPQAQPPADAAAAAATLSLYDRFHAAARNTPRKEDADDV